MVERYLRGRARVSQHAKVRNDGVVVACGGTVRGTHGTPELSAPQGARGDRCPVPLPCAAGTHSKQEAGTRLP